MRVLFVVWDYPTETLPIGPFHRTAAEALSRQGLEVEVMAPVPWLPRTLQRLSEKASLPLQIRQGPVTVHRPRYLRLPRPFLLRSCEWAMEKAVRRAIVRAPDVIHSHFAYPYGGVGLTLAKRFQVPTVVTLHGSDINNWPQFAPWLQRRSREVVRQSDAVVAVSEALAQKTYEVTGRRVPVWRIGINLRNYRQLPDQLEARRMLNLPLDKKLVLYAGIFKQEKGIRELLQALDLLSDDGLLSVMVGDGPLREQVEESRYCKIVGFVPNERIPLYMRAADVFVLPSYSEGLPTVLVEAGAAGLPIVATTVGGIPELLAGDRGLLVEPKSSQDVATAVKSVLDQPVEAAQRADRMREHVDSLYDTDKNAEMLRETYDGLIRSKCGAESKTRPAIEQQVAG